VQVGQTIVSSYSIEGAASLKLVQSANHLSVGGVNPEDGYVFSADNVSPTRVIVTLTNATQRLKFNAEIIGGRVVTSLISSDVVAPVVTAAPAVAASPSSTTPRRSRDSRRENQNRQKDEDEDEDDNRSNRDRRGDNDDD
jgi:ribosomal protein L12E/L44/L45/RPP1/RPP2